MIHVQSTAYQANAYPAISCAYGANVTSGNLLVCCVATNCQPGSTSTATVTVSDSNNNTWFQVGSYSYLDYGGGTTPKNHVGISGWYAVSNGTGACTVTATANNMSGFDSLSGLGVMEYQPEVITFPNMVPTVQAAPVVSTNTAGSDSSTGTTWTTGNITVNASKQLVLGFFFAISYGALAPGTGFTLRIGQAACCKPIYVLDMQSNSATFPVSGTCTLPTPTDNSGYVSLGAVFKK